MTNRVMRAKMTVRDRVQHDSDSQTVTFSAVGRNDRYPEDGTDEDNDYARWTPNANLQMLISNPNLQGKLNLGDTFYVDFTPVGPAPDSGLETVVEDGDPIDSNESSTASAADQEQKLNPPETDTGE